MDRAGPLSVHLIYRSQLNGYSKIDDQSDDDAEEVGGRDQQIIRRHCSVVFGPRREGTRLGERPAAIDSYDLIIVE